MQSCFLAGSQAPAVFLRRCPGPSRRVRSCGSGAADGLGDAVSLNSRRPTPRPADHAARPGPSPCRWRSPERRTAEAARPGGCAALRRRGRRGSEGRAPFGTPGVRADLGSGSRDARASPRRADRPAHSPSAIVEALAGVALTPDALRTIVSGCGLAVGESPPAAGPMPADWAAVDVAGTTTYLRRSGAAWQILGAAHEALTVFYADFQNGRPGTVHIQTGRTGGSAASHLRLSQIETNPTLDPRTFHQEIPAAGIAADPRRAAARRTRSAMRRARPATRSDRRMKKRTTDHRPRPREGESRPPGARRAIGWLSRAAHGLSDHRAARHARLRRASGAVHAEVPDAGVPLDDEQPDLEGGGAPVDRARTRRGDARHDRDDRQADSRAGRARRRQRRRGGGPGCARRGCGVARRWARCGRSRRALAPTCRSFSPAARRSVWDEARRSTRSSICRRTGS